MFTSSLTKKPSLVPSTAVVVHPAVTEYRDCAPRTVLQRHIGGGARPPEIRTPWWTDPKVMDKEMSDAERHRRCESVKWHCQPRKPWSLNLVLAAEAAELSHSSGSSLSTRSRSGPVALRPTSAVAAAPVVVTASRARSSPAAVIPPGTIKTEWEGASNRSRSNSNSTSATEQMACVMDIDAEEDEQDVVFVRSSSPSPRTAEKKKQQKMGTEALSSRPLRKREREDNGRPPSPLDATTSASSSPLSGSLFPSGAVAGGRIIQRRLEEKKTAGESPGEEDHSSGNACSSLRHRVGGSSDEEVHRVCSPPLGDKASASDGLSPRFPSAASDDSGTATPRIVVSQGSAESQSTKKVVAAAAPPLSSKVSSAGEAKKQQQRSILDFLSRSS